MAKDQESIGYPEVLSNGVTFHELIPGQFGDDEVIPITWRPVRHGVPLLCWLVSP